jgi:hypothetical protein
MGIVKPTVALSPTMPRGVPHNEIKWSECAKIMLHLHSLTRSQHFQANSGTVLPHKLRHSPSRSNGLVWFVEHPDQGDFLQH